MPALLTHVQSLLLLPGCNLCYTLTQRRSLFDVLQGGRIAWIGFQSKKNPELPGCETLSIHRHVRSFPRACLPFCIPVTTLHLFYHCNATIIRSGFVSCAFTYLSIDNIMYTSPYGTISQIKNRYTIYELREHYTTHSRAL